MGVRCGDLRVQSWNCNSMMKKHRSWVQFINKLKTQMKTFLSLLILDLSLSMNGSLKNCGTGQSFITLIVAIKGVSLFLLKIHLLLKI